MKLFLSTVVVSVILLLIVIFSLRLSLYNKIKIPVQKDQVVNETPIYAVPTREQRNRLKSIIINTGNVQDDQWANTIYRHAQDKLGGIYVPNPNDYIIKYSDTKATVTWPVPLSKDPNRDNPPGPDIYMEAEVDLKTKQVGLVTTG